MAGCHRRRAGRRPHPKQREVQDSYRRTWRMATCRDLLFLPIRVETKTVELIRSLLEQQPLMALFLTIALGYLVGEINIKGFSLGVGAVLFVALAVGWFAPKSVPAPMVGTLGLALFLYGVGVQYGKQFFIGLTSSAGLRANVMALTGVLAAGAVSLIFVKMMDLKLGYALGLFAGS